MQHVNRRQHLKFHDSLLSDLSDEQVHDYKRLLAWMVLFFFLSYAFLLIAKAMLLSPYRSSIILVLQAPVYFGLVFFFPFLFTLLAARALNVQHTLPILVLLFVPVVVLRVFTLPIDPSVFPLLYSLGATCSGFIIGKHL